MAREPPFGKPIRAAFSFVCSQFLYRRASEAAWSPKPRPEGSTPSAGAFFPALVSAATVRATRVRPRSSVDRAAASEAAGRRFDSGRGHQPARRGGVPARRRVGPAVRIPGSHPGDPGSTPGRATGETRRSAGDPCTIASVGSTPTSSTVADAEGDEAPGCGPGRSRCESGRPLTRAVRQPAGPHKPRRRGSTPRRATAPPDPCHDGHEAACKAAGTGFDSRAGLRTAETVGAPV